MIKKYLSGNNFTKNIITLMSGTMIAQVIPVAISPILTRMYSPDEFGMLALYVAILSILSVAASMRYELAIVQSENDEEAKALVHLSVMICTILFSVVLILVSIYDFIGNDFLGLGISTEVLYILPFGFLLNGLIQVGRYWLLRQGHYKNISGIVVSQSTGSGSGQLLAGKMSIAGGMVYGQLLGQLFAFTYTLFNSFVLSRELFKGMSINESLKAAKRYQNMPKYSIPGALSDNFSVQLPVLVISRVYGSEIVGFFSLTFKVLSLPLAALSGALSQVLYKKISVLAVDDPGQIKPMLIKSNLILITLSVPFVVFLWFFGEPSFAFVFGEAWRASGKMAGIVAVAVAVRFCVSPLSAVLAMDKNVRLGSAWQFLYLVTISLTFFTFYQSGMETFLFAFVVHEFFIYSLYYYLILKGTDRLEGAQ